MIPPAFSRTLWAVAERLPGIGRLAAGADRTALGRAAAGWYALRVVGAPSAVRASAAVRFADEARPMRIPLRPGLPSLRILHLDRPGALAFAPDHTVPARAALLRLPGPLARSMVRRQLRRKHPDYFGGDPSTPNPRAFATQWADYNDLFDRPSAARLSYSRWRACAERPVASAAQRADAAGWSPAPRLLVVISTAGAAEAPRAATEASLQAQGYPHWEAFVVDPAPDAETCAAALSRCSAVVFVESGDVLRPDALYHLARALADPSAPSLVYSDHDHLDAAGRRFDPCFKPGPSPDLLLARNFIAPLAAMRSDAVAAGGGLQAAWSLGTAGAHTLAWILALRLLATGHASRSTRIAEVLCHRPQAAVEADGDDDHVAVAAVNAHLARQAGDGVAPHAVAIGPGLRRVLWPLPPVPPLVSIVIPTRNAAELVLQCIGSIERVTAYRAYEILLVDNQSDDPAALACFADLERTGRARLLRFDAPFNYSAINNFAVRQARGSLLALVNNDVEAVSPEWLGEMVGLALRPGIGCVGAKLDFPDGTIQHAGVVLGIGGIAGHAYKYQRGDAPGYFDRLRVAHEVAAVTGAVMVLRKSLFEELGGFDEVALQVAYNDVDLCLRALRAGYRNLWTPHAHLIHHESKTRGLEDTEPKRARWQAERNVMRGRWAAWLDDDPFYNPHLSRTHEDYSLRVEAAPP